MTPGGPRKTRDVRRSMSNRAAASHDGAFPRLELSADHGIAPHFFRRQLPRLQPPLRRRTTRAAPAAAVQDAK